MKLGQCGQCGAYVLAEHIQGVRVAADVMPLTVDGYREALIAGRAVYVLRTAVDGTFRKLDFDAGWVAAETPRVAEHGCKAVPRPLEAPKKGPQASVCAVWTSAGWIPPPSCPRRSQGDTGPQSCQTCEPPPF